MIHYQVFEEYLNKRNLIGYFDNEESAIEFMNSMKLSNKNLRYYIETIFED